MGESQAMLVSKILKGLLRNLTVNSESDWKLPEGFE